MKPALAILAAGASSRLGTCKALAPITPRNALDILLENGSIFDSAPALVVTGADHVAIVRALSAESRDGRDARQRTAIARNAHWERGRTGSVLLAARLRRGFDLCLAPVDVPLVPRAIFAALDRAWTAAGSPARGWLAPRHAGRFGHPLVVGARLLEELAGFDAATPLRALRSRAEPLIAVDVECGAILDDFDSPSDLSALRARFYH